MKTIKIFLASSEELQTERDKMADLVLHLNKLFKGRGLQLDLEKWEYLDASMSGKRKQDEYNDVLHQCDICMVLFWRRFGSYTGEELDVAYKSMLGGGNPQKIYVFFKNPGGDDVSQEIRNFISDYEQRFGGHFFCKFQTVDTLKLEFLLQLENYQKDLIGEKAIEVRNEHVYVDNEVMVDLMNVADIPARSRELVALGADYIAVHTAFDVQAQGRTPLGDLTELVGAIEPARAAVAGGVKQATVASYVALDPGIVIAGAALYNAPDIRQAVIDMKGELR